MPNRTLCPKLNLKPPSTPQHLYDSAVAYFSSIPWTHALLSRPNVIPYIPECVNPPPNGANDQFLGTTLSSPRALKHMLSLFHSGGGNENESLLLRDPKVPITRASSLFALGDGLVGHPGVVHGGMVVTMMDEAMGVVFGINEALGKSGAVFQNPTLTAGFDVTLSRPVPVGEIIADAWIEDVQGRKAKLRCEIKDKHGVLLAKCSSVWVSLRPKL